MQVTAFGLNLPLQWATSLCMHAVSSAFMWVLCCRTNKAAGAVPCVVCASGVHQQLPDCCYHLQLGVCSQGGFLGPCCLSCMPGVCQYVCVCSQTCLSPPLCCVSNRLGTVPKWMHCRWRPRFHSTQYVAGALLVTTSGRRCIAAQGALRERRVMAFGSWHCVVPRRWLA